MVPAKEVDIPAEGDPVDIPLIKSEVANEESVSCLRVKLINTNTRELIILSGQNNGIPFYNLLHVFVCVCLS